MDSMNEKNFKVGVISISSSIVALAAVLVTVGVLGNTAATQESVKRDTARYQLGVACVQAGGEWRDRDADCLKKG